MRCSSSVWLRWLFSLRSSDAQRQGDPIGDMLKLSSYEGVVSTVDAVIHTAQYAIQGRFTRKKLEQIEQAASGYAHDVDSLTGLSGTL